MMLEVITSENQQNGDHTVGINHLYYFMTTELDNRRSYN